MQSTRCGILLLIAALVIFAGVIGGTESVHAGRGRTFEGPYLGIGSVCQDGIELASGYYDRDGVPSQTEPYTGFTFDFRFSNGDVIGEHTVLEYFVRHVSENAFSTAGESSYMWPAGSNSDDFGFDDPPYPPGRIIKVRVGNYWSTDVIVEDCLLSSDDPDKYDFEYHALLQDEGEPANGAYDLRLRLYEADESDSTMLAEKVIIGLDVADGLITVDTDFGQDIFTGDPIWLDVAVRPSGTADFTPLNERTRVGAIPYAIHAYTTDPHSHLGETWYGNDPLRIEGAANRFFQDPEQTGIVILRNSFELTDEDYCFNSNCPLMGDGLQVQWTTGNGIVVNSAGQNGIWVQNSGNGYHAGRFDGDVQVNGTLSKSAGSFKIDHPLDPANKTLSHSFVESPDMMNIYNGNVVLQADGSAWVEMPEWFQALNQDFRYQLTAIGAPGPNLYVATEIENNRFRIAGGAAGMKVSWQVTGIRHDPYAEQNRIPVEEWKPKAERGTYLNPDVYHLDEEWMIRAGGR